MLEGAVAAFRRALQIRPGSAPLYNNLGNALRELRRYEEAVLELQKALALRPELPDALNNLGIALTGLNRRQEAVACLRKALELQPDFADAHSNLGTVLLDLERYAEAAACFDKALKLRPGFPEAYVSLGNALGKLKHHQEAIASYGNALGFRPGYWPAVLGMATQRRQVCDWRHFEEETRTLRSAASSGREPVAPFFFLSVSDDPREQLACARRAAAEIAGKLAPLGPLQRPRENAFGPIRIAYVSNCFHQHAMTFLTAELFERHDRERFEIHAFSVGPDRDDPMRRRLASAFHSFHDLRERSDREAAQLVRDLGCHLALDLMGYEADCRPGILAHRVAPIQVAYLQHAGSMGADFIDYALVDRFVVPEDQAPFYAEKLVTLPNCYQVNQSEREIAPGVPSRTACGLPEEGFVFCSFNNSKKITPEVFDVWMRLLGAVPGSVLWLLQDNETAARNLRREAEARGIAPDRLVFAPSAALPEHLARHRLADLFLDTFPYSAHTTASDALWAGLPILTYSGRAFASRVAGSLLNALGLPELITYSLDNYEALALEFARDPEVLGAYRQRLAQNRRGSPLFDCQRFTRNLEAAYTAMVKRWRAGLAPVPFSVADLGPTNQPPG